MNRLLNTLAIVSLGGFLTCATTNNIAKGNVNKYNTIITNNDIPSEHERGGLIDFTDAAEKTINTVVHIKTQSQQKTQYYDDFFGLNPFFRDFFWGLSPNQRQQTQEIQTAGSGVIITENGYIVTNNHVVDGVDAIEVILNDKRSYKAKLIGNDPTTDLALIKIEEEKLPFIVYGNSDNVKVGEWVLAVGNPFNLTSTVTAGIVSAKARNINILGGNTSVESFIQTDAAVNPGNSGGALVNTSGELIGINAAIASNTGSYTGYSFAIPVNIVKKVVNDLIEFGDVQRAFLGVSILEIDANLAQQKNIKDLKGVYVEALNENITNEDIGIKRGDVITKVNQQAVNSIAQLQESIAIHRPGENVSVTIKRNGEELTIPVLLRNKYGETSIVKRDVTKESAQLLGATFKVISKEEMNKLNIRNGLKIIKLDNGKLRNAGIREGFIIQYIDKKEVADLNDIHNALSNKRGGILIEGTYPNGMRAYYAFGL